MMPARALLPPLHTGPLRGDFPPARVDAGLFALTVVLGLAPTPSLGLPRAREPSFSHIKKFELVKGDASEEVEKYLADHPETIIALAYFDMDLYEPTKRCLSAIKDHIAGGAIIGFDELNHRNVPGETVAFKEAFGAGRFKLHRSPMNPTSSYVVFGGD